jgi:hypothetical protein
MNNKEYLSRITVENNEVHEKKIVWEIPYNDATLDDWLHGFLTCMVGITFSEETVLRGMRDFVEERLPVDEENVDDYIE